jgi:hemin uptake protein HemP
MSVTRDKPAPPSAAPLRPLSERELFQGRHEVEIEFRGERYRLRITRNEKLILTK